MKPLHSKPALSTHYQALIIGGGSAGLAAAIELKNQGIENMAILERDFEPGGILQQCIHNGFGLQTFQEQLSGPEYAERFSSEVAKHHIPLFLNTTVTHLSSDGTIEAINPEQGVMHLSADAILLAVGCYERARGALNIPGSRPAGIYTAGQAQRYLNMEGYLVGKNVFILGSGDIGLIMARRMTLEGAKVLGVAEVCPYSNGLPRNLKQCLEDFAIPLYLSHTITNIFGTKRLEAIELSQVDENRQKVAGTERIIPVDTLLLSVGLIPENHLADEAGLVMNPATKGPVVDERYMTSAPGIFACGNGLHVHDLVDFVTLQAKRAAKGAAAYLHEKDHPYEVAYPVLAKGQTSYVVPGQIHPSLVQDKVEFFFRVKKPMENVTIRVKSEGILLKQVRKKKMIPSEMERLSLDPTLLKTLKAPLEIEVVGIEE